MVFEALGMICKENRFTHFQSPWHDSNFIAKTMIFEAPGMICEKNIFALHSTKTENDCWHDFHRESFRAASRQTENN